MRYFKLNDTGIKAGHPLGVLTTVCIFEYDPDNDRERCIYDNEPGCEIIDPEWGSAHGTGPDRRFWIEITREDAFLEMI